MTAVLMVRSLGSGRFEVMFQNGALLQLSEAGARECASDPEAARALLMRASRTVKSR